MGDIIPLGKRAGRRLKDTIFTDRGLRLSNPTTNPASRWFAFGVTVLSALIFLVVAFTP